MKKLFICSFLLFSSLSLFSCKEKVEVFCHDLLIIDLRIPDKIIYNEKEYYKDESFNFSLIDEELNFVGYLINQKDLEIWKEVDNNDELIYIIDETNELYYKAFGDCGITLFTTSRFEVYFTNSLNEIIIDIFHEGYSAYVYNE